MQGLAVICDLAAAVLLAIGAMRGAGGRPLPALVPLLASGLGFAALAAILAAQPSFGGFLLILLALGVGGTLGAGVTIATTSVARVPLFLTGLLVLYGIVAILLSAAIVDTGTLFWRARMASGDIERLGAAAVAAIAGSLVLGGGSVLFLRRIGGPRELPAPSGWMLRSQAVAAAVAVLFAGIFLITRSPLAFWLCACAGAVAGALVALSTDTKARWPLSVLLTGLCGLATAAIGFALASLVMIVAGGLVGASMASVFADLSRESGRRPLSMLFGRRN